MDPVYYEDLSTVAHYLDLSNTLPVIKTMVTGIAQVVSPLYWQVENPEKLLHLAAEKAELLARVLDPDTSCSYPMAIKWLTCLPKVRTM